MTLERFGERMKNTDYVVTISTKAGVSQTYRRTPKHWTQTSSAGNVRSLTAEQLLSHLLAALASPTLIVTVETKGGNGDSHQGS